MAKEELELLWNELSLLHLAAKLPQALLLLVFCRGGKEAAAATRAPAERPSNLRRYFADVLSIVSQQLQPV